MSGQGHAAGPWAVAASGWSWKFSPLCGEELKRERAIKADLLEALDDLAFTVGVTAIKYPDQLPALEAAVQAARAAIAKATEGSA